MTTIAGLLLYGLLSYHETMRSAMGVILTIGALFGLFAVWRQTGAYRRLIVDAGADVNGLTNFEDSMRRNGRVGRWLALASLILMAGAR